MRIGCNCIISAVSKVDFDFLEHLIEELRAADLNDDERKLVEKFFKSAPRCPVLEELLPFCYLTGRVLSGCYAAYDMQHVISLSPKHGDISNSLYHILERCTYRLFVHF